MVKEWIDVADTAVKIGFGALITGVFTYLGILYSHKSARSKFMLEHKTKLLEQASEDIEEYFNAWRSYISLVAGVAKRRKNHELENERLTKKQLDAIRKNDHILVESWSKRNSAIAKLRLMKAVTVADSLIECQEVEKNLREGVAFMKEIPLHDEFSEYADSVRNVTRKVHKELADFYHTFDK